MMIRVEDLHKYYHEAGGQLQVLQGLHFEVSKGKIVVIMGVSGAGKSTFLNLLGGLDVPTVGRILYGDVDLSSLKGDALASFRNQKVGFVFQFHYLLPEFDVLENVMMPGLIAGVRREALGERAQKVLTDVGLTERATHRPSELSGGECQRVAVARALMNEPDVVLADEPSGNLDKGNSRRLHELLRSLCESKGQTFVIATHNEHLAAVADRVLHLADGVLQEEAA